MIKTTLVEVLDPAWIPLHCRHKVFTSLEGENPGGSIKDHIVAGKLAAWAAQGELRPGRVLTEASAGSTARSLAFYAREYGCHCVIFAPSSLPLEHLTKLKLDLEALGALLQVEPANIIFEKLKLFTSANDGLYLDQMSDSGKRQYYGVLAAAIEENLGPQTALIGAVGTGHSLLGISGGLRARPLLISAEPQPGHQVPGVRNVEETRFGASDPVNPSDFGLRFITKPLAFAPSFLSTEGLIRGTESFGLVLEAASKYLLNQTDQRVFLIGAANCRTRRI